MKIFCKCPTVYISKLNFLLLICIAKNFIWTTLKMIFSIFRFFCTLRFSNSCISAKYFPILTNHTSLDGLFIQLWWCSMLNLKNYDPYDWFCGPGSHMCMLCISRRNFIGRRKCFYWNTCSRALLSCCWAQFPIMMIYVSSLSQRYWVGLDWRSGSEHIKHTGCDVCLVSQVFFYVYFQPGAEISLTLESISGADKDRQEIPVEGSAHHHCRY